MIFCLFSNWKSGELDKKKDAVRKIQPFVSNILNKLQHFIRLSIISWVATWRSIDCLSCCCCWNRRSCRLRRGIHRSVPTDRQVADDRRNPPAERRRRCANAATSNISRDDEFDFESSPTWKVKSWTAEHRKSTARSPSEWLEIEWGNSPGWDWRLV